MPARPADPTTTRARVARAAALGAVATVLIVGLVIAAAPAAMAHGPNGLFQVQRTNVVAPLTLAFRVRLIYTNDTEPVTAGATVTVQGSGPGGSVGPIGMGYTGTDGYYTATVTFPAGGSWAITFLSQNPAAQYAQTEVVPSPTPPPTDPPPSSAPSPTAPSTTEAPITPTSEALVPEPTTTTAALSTTTAAPTTDEIAAAPVSAQTDAGYDYLFVAVGAIAAAVALGGTSLFAWRGANR